MKSMLQKMAYITICALLVMGVFNALTARVVKAEEEMPTTQQDSGNPTETTTTTTDKNSWSEFLSDESNDQTIIEETPEQLNQEEQMKNIEASNGVGQSKDVYNEAPPEETQDEEEDNPIIYTYKVKYLDCDGNVIKEETIETDQPTDDVVVKAEGCSIPTNPRPTNDIPPTSTVVVEKVYDNTPAAPWYVYLAAAVVVVGIAFCFAKPSMAKKAVKEQI